MNGFDQTSDTQRPPWKIVALVVGAAVVAVALIVGAVLFVRSRQKVEIATQNMDRIETQLASSIASCSEDADPAGCRKKKAELVAGVTKSADPCEQLDGKDRDSCVWTVARENLDSATCGLISDDAFSTACLEGVSLQLAKTKNDAGYCDDIVDSTKRAGCLNLVNGPLSAENCLSRGEDKATCDNMVLYEAALKSRDPEQCKTLLIEADQLMCMELIGTDPRGTVGSKAVDTDGDGLSDAVETGTYHTDPKNPDTDGDGYSDKVEIDGGYNPNGPGTL